MKKATITKINNNIITAQLSVDSMCGTCPSSASCFIKDCSKKEVEIKIQNAKSYNIGDVIEISIDANSSFTALFFAYILPLFILLFVFYGLNYYNYSQINCGSFAIISLIPYYFLLYLNKEKISNKVEVKINDN